MKTTRTLAAIHQSAEAIAACIEAEFAKDDSRADKLPLETLIRRGLAASAPTVALTMTGNAWARIERRAARTTPDAPRLKVAETLRRLRAEVGDRDAMKLLAEATRKTTPPARHRRACTMADQ